MWIYEKKLQYPVKVSKCDPRMAKLLLEQYAETDPDKRCQLWRQRQGSRCRDRAASLYDRPAKPQIRLYLIWVPMRRHNGNG